MRFFLTKIRIALRFLCSSRVLELSELLGTQTSYCPHCEQQQQRLRALEDELRLTQMEVQDLGQLRTHGMTEHGRIGYGVTCFIPEDVLQQLRKADTKNRALFINIVACDLVDRAIKGLWYRNNENKVSAMIFEDKGKDHKVHAIYQESANKAPQIITNKKVYVVTPPSEVARQIEDNLQAMGDETQKLFGIGPQKTIYEANNGQD